MNEREREKVWQCHVCSSQQVACMLADCRDGGGGGGLVAVLSAQKESHSIAHGGRAGQAFSLPECRAKALFTSCKAGCNVRPALDSG